MDRDLADHLAADIITGFFQIVAGVLGAIVGVIALILGLTEWAINRG